MISLGNTIFHLYSFKLRGFLRTNLCTMMNISLGNWGFCFLFFRYACDVTPQDFPTRTVGFQGYMISSGKILSHMWFSISWVLRTNLRTMPNIFFENLGFFIFYSSTAHVISPLDFSTLFNRQRSTTLVITLSPFNKLRRELLHLSFTKDLAPSLEDF